MIWGPLAAFVHDAGRPRSGRSRLFPQTLLEACSVTPPVLVAAIYVPVSVWLCWRGIVAGVPPAGVAGLFAIGALIWSWPAAWLHPMR